MEVIEEVNKTLMSFVQYWYPILIGVGILLRQIINYIRSSQSFYSRVHAKIKQADSVSEIINRLNDAGLQLVHNDLLKDDLFYLRTRMRFVGYTRELFTQSYDRIRKVFNLVQIKRIQNYLYVSNGKLITERGFTVRLDNFFYFIYCGSLFIVTLSLTVYIHIIGDNREWLKGLMIIISLIPLFPITRQILVYRWIRRYRKEFE
jgi:hypothetical protein